MPLQPRNRDRVTIPVLTRELLPALAEGGEELWSPYKVSSRPLRSCSGCNLSAHCPGFEDGASCAFEIPIRITTKAELLQAQSALLEMQMQRISFGRLQEDLLSQGLDSIVSQEMERFMRMVEAMQRSSQVTESVTITRKAEAGAISRLFGTEVGDAQLRLANPMTPNELNESIMDADILDDIPPPPP